MGSTAVSDWNLLGVSAALGSAVSWSVGALLFKRLGEQLSSYAMTAIKGLMSVALLGAAALLVKDDGNLDGAACAYLAASGVLGITLADTLFFAALQSLGARPVVLLSTLGQVFTVMLAVVLLGERIGLQQWGGIALILAGVTVGMYPGPSAPHATSLRGVLLGVGSMVCMAASVILTKKGVASISTLHATLIRMIAGTAGIFLVGAATGRLRRWVAPIQGATLMRQFFLAVCVITFGGFWLTTVAFKFTSVAVASSLIATEPLFILPLSAVFLSERITLLSVAGAVLATMGVVTLCTSGGLT